jgi:aspartyl aminopeptidase
VVAAIRRIFNSAGVTWQTGELGKVDQGGGGTIAHFLAEHGMDVLDCGVPLLGMHSPLEVASKADIYMAYLGYRSFLTGLH